MRSSAARQRRADFVDERSDLIPLPARWFERFLGQLSPLGSSSPADEVQDHALGQTSLVDAIAQVSIQTADIEWSRAWYEDVAGLLHSRTTDWEPHPGKQGWRIRCCYMSASRQPECLVLVEQYDPERGIIAPLGGCVFHLAIEVEWPAGPGEPAAAPLNRDLFDPDWNSVELVRPNLAGAPSAAGSPAATRRTQLR